VSLATELQEAAAIGGKPYPAGRFDGRGIVICAGGARFYTCAWVAIGILRRHLGCSLPIEVWYLGAPEMGPPMRSLLQAEGVHLVDALEVARIHPAAPFGGWELKTYAVVHSRFREVLLLDADNVPVDDPAFLFDRPEFTGTGALFWPDIVRIARSNAIWALSGLGFHDGPAFESGQLLIDKSRCWQALQLALWMNQRAEVFYEHLYGDKDTFLIAWLMCRTPFTLISHMPRLLESTMCQRDPDGRVLFQHRNAAKWILFGRNPAVAGFQLEPECRRLLKELSLRWDGHVFNPPPRSAECRRIEADLSAQRRFRMIRLGDRETQLDFEPDHRAGHTSKLDFYWHVEDGPALILHYGGLRCCALTLGPDGAWRGDYLRPPYMPVVLVPSDAAPAAGIPSDARPAAVLFDELLALYETLPFDAETARDFVGAIRSLARLWPQSASWLQEAVARNRLSPIRGALLDEALGALGAAGQRSAGVTNRPFDILDYDRL
jgi:Mannosyltransferase putative